LWQCATLPQEAPGASLVACENANWHARPPARAGGFLECVRPPGGQRMGASARGCPCHGAGVGNRAQPGWRKRGFLRVSEGHGCPERTSGDVARATPSRATQNFRPPREHLGSFCRRLAVVGRFPDFATASESCPTWRQLRKAVLPGDSFGKLSYICCSRHQATVAAIPASKSCRGSQPRSVFARVMSRLRRGWPSGLEASQAMRPA
jgi:hypothetical protein